MIEKVLRRLNMIESMLLGMVLIAMVLIATAQIILRNFFDMGLIWADPLLRVMLLWLGMLGAMAASQDNKHIAIDILSKFMPSNILPWTQLITSLFTTVVCAVVAWHSARFVIDEYQYQTQAFSGIPAWCFAIIIPVAFGLIALRYAVLAVQFGIQGKRLWRGR